MTNDAPVNSKFLEKLAAKRAADEAVKQAQQNELLKWAEFVPDVEPLSSPGLSEQEKTFDEFIRLIPITEAYVKWGGKSQIENPNKEEIKARCPNPNHGTGDNDPSFVMNTQKNVFMCFKCGGGDLYDIAAWFHGFPVPGYKDKAYFRQLKDCILADYGMQVHTAPGAEDTVVQVELPVIPQITEPSTVNNVIYTPQGAGYAEPSVDQQAQANRQHDSIDWRSIVPDNTFMRAYLDATTTDTCPEEFHFWLSLVGVGLAAGLNRQTEEEPRVKGNLFVCLTGPTGTGKSRAKAHLKKLVLNNIKFDPDEAVPQGTKLAGNLQSGEIIVKRFQHEIIDPATGKGTGKYLPVRVLLDSEEMAGIATRASRPGNSLKDILQQVYDCGDVLTSEGMTHDLYAVMPFGSLVTTTQNRSIREVMTKSDGDSGFTNRWIFATGVAKPELAINFNTVDLTRAGGLIRLIKKDCMQFEPVKYEQQAIKTYSDFFHSHITQYKNREDTKLMQRLDLTMKKLCLLFSINNREKVITQDTVNRVIQLFNYLVESYGVIEEQVAATEHGDNEQFLINTVKRLVQSGRFPSSRDIYLATKHRFQNTEQMKKMLTALVDVGEFIHQRMPAAGGKGGRPKDVYIPADCLQASST